MKNIGKVLLALICTIAVTTSVFLTNGVIAKAEEQSELVPAKVIFTREMDVLYASTVKTRSLVPSNRTVNELLAQSFFLMEMKKIDCKMSYLNMAYINLRQSNS